MNKPLIGKNFLKILKILKKIIITLFSLTGFLILISPIIIFWLFWKIGTVNSLYNRVDLKTQRLGHLFFCKEKAEEKNPAKDQVYQKDHHDLTANYKFQVEAGYCPANKEEAKNIEPIRIKLCKEIKSDLEKAEKKFFGKQNRSAKERYEDFIVKGLCPKLA
jgi:hypothetical protein